MVSRFPPYILGMGFLSTIFITGQRNHLTTAPASLLKYPPLQKYPLYVPRDCKGSHLSWLHKRRLHLGSCSHLLHVFWIGIAANSRFVNLRKTLLQSCGFFHLRTDKLLECSQRVDCGELLASQPHPRLSNICIFTLLTSVTSRYPILMWLNENDWQNKALTILSPVMQMLWVIMVDFMMHVFI